MKFPDTIRYTLRMLRKEANMRDKENQIPGNKKKNTL